MHIQLEKEIPYDDFIDIILKNEIDGYKIDYRHSLGHWMEGYTYPHFRMKDGDLTFYHGASIVKIDKERNQNIKYGFGYFYFDYKVFNTIETDERDNFDEIIYEKLETFKIKQMRLAILQRLKN